MRLQNPRSHHISMKCGSPEEILPVMSYGSAPHQDLICKRIPLGFLRGNNIKTWYESNTMYIPFKTLKRGTKLISVGPLHRRGTEW